MIRSTMLLAGAIVIAAAAAGCEDSATGPGAPVFLEGLWRGTITLHVADEPPVEGKISCLFTPRGSATEPRASAACSIESDWLATSFGGDLALDDAEPPAGFQLATTYTSPRGCQGTLQLEGEATTSRLTATANGIDCGDVPWIAELLLTPAG